MDNHSHFPETNYLDADHAWLAPVKADSDNFAVDLLLQYVPENYSPNWQQVFIKNLQSANTETAKTLAMYLTNTKYEPGYFKEMARHYLINLRFQPANSLYRQLVQNRELIRSSEISKNPKGQILEPGFRIIFPEVNKDIG